MKSERQAAIRALLKNQPIQTQEELVDALCEQGFRVTQATVSRDMKEMHLIKVPAEEGGYRYEEPEIVQSGLSDRLIRLLKDCVTGIEPAGQMVVVKTISGAAGTAAETLDSLDMPEIVGSIAGDNTIFLAARDHESAAVASARIRNLIN